MAWQNNLLRVNLTTGSCNNEPLVPARYPGASRVVGGGMAIGIKLVGFGDDQPPRFNGRNRIQIDLQTPTSVNAILQSAGIDNSSGLVLMDSNSVMPPGQWSEFRIEDQTALTILSAFEGG